MTIVPKRFMGETIICIVDILFVTLNSMGKKKNKKSSNNQLFDFVHSLNLRLKREQKKRFVIVEKVRLKRLQIKGIAELWNINDLDVVLDGIELEMENCLIEMFETFGIHATVKTEKKSLPFQFEIYTYF